jgi:integrase
MTVAKKTLARIEEAIAMGTWFNLKAELSRRVEKELTIADFSKIYLEEYCRARNTRPDFKEQAMTSILRILGDVPLRELRRAHAHQFITTRRSEVAAATVNRGLAVLKNMVTFALDKEYIEQNPLQRFRMLPEEQKALRVMTLEEERQLIRAVSSVDHTIGVYVALLGETGLRKSEGLNLKWELVNFQQRILSVEETKSGKARYVPLSDFAIAQLQSLVRMIDVPYVFVQLDARKPWRDPRGPFEKGKTLAGLDWVGFHDLRHFRATQWVMRGVDLRTVQEFLGHSSITTTMRYAHFSPGYANKSVREAQAAESQEVEKLQNSQEENRRHAQ